MKFPKLKNTLQCYIVLGLLLIAAFLLPFVIALCLSPLSEGLSIFVTLVLLFAELIILVVYLPYLIGIEMLLATINCTNMSRKYFVLPECFDKASTVNRINRFGKGYEPIGISPKPDMLLYRATSSVTVITSGIERIVAVYNTDLLNKDKYLLIKSSAVANSKDLAGKKKVSADNLQKSEPLNRTTVFYVFADTVDDGFRASLHEQVCKGIGDGFDEAILPCIIDLETRRCFFDSMRMPYVGQQYPSKNRGINIIKKHIFNNRFTYAESKEKIDDQGDFDLEMTLWQFLRDLRNDIRLDSKKTKKRFEKMRHKEIIAEDDYLYLKWNDRGLWISAECDEETCTVTLDAVEYWDYPKHQKIAKQTVDDIKRVINAYYSELGYGVKYEKAE